MSAPSIKPKRLQRSILSVVMLSHLLTVSITPFAQAYNHGELLVESTWDQLQSKSMAHSTYVDLISSETKATQKRLKKSSRLERDAINALALKIIEEFKQSAAQAKSTRVDMHDSIIPSIEHETIEPEGETTSKAAIKVQKIDIPDQDDVDSIPESEPALGQKLQAQKILDHIDSDMDAATKALSGLTLTSGDDDESRDPLKPSSSHLLDSEESVETQPSKRLTREEMVSLVKQEPSTFLKTLFENRASFEDFQAIILEVAPAAHRKLYDAKMIDTRIYDQSFLVSLILGTAGVLTDVFAMGWFKQTVQNKALIEGIVPLMQQTGDWVGSKIADTVFEKILQSSQNVLMTMAQKSLEVIVGDAVKVELFKWAPHLAQTLVDHTILSVSKAVRAGASYLSSLVSKKALDASPLKDPALDEPAPEEKVISPLEAFWQTMVQQSEMNAAEVEEVLSLINPVVYNILREENLSTQTLHRNFWQENAWKAMKFAGSFAYNVGFSFAFSPLFGIVMKRLVSNVLISKVGQPLSDYISQNYYVNWALNQKAAGNMSAVRAELDALKMGLDPKYIPTSGLRDLPVLSTIADGIDAAREGLQSALGRVISKETLDYIPIIGAPDTITELDMVAKVYWDQMLIGAADATAQAAYHPAMDGAKALLGAVQDKLSSANKQMRVRKKRTFFDPTRGGHGKDPSTYDHYDPKTGVLSND